MSRVSVIGAAGKVGKRLVSLLVSNGHDVTALHRQRVD
ncbi:NmrA family NAD(P)-binding protein [Pseudomonas sp. CFBP 8770]|nr:MULTISPECIES: NAD-dependent epimerase/dehydratase family protein [unclassified Pseudomonas]MBD8473387.1 NmrA family NAD(P)-binding protein [Pseudomonas sp. CFBP 8773]MBD8646514.1 NmrA family NAD(P)-binding protein [Pseudomonas sp. CFBP 8770]